MYAVLKHCNRASNLFSLLALLHIIIGYCHAWTTRTSILTSSSIRKINNKKTTFNFNLQAAPAGHGENSCFLPLKQLDQEYCAPRIVQIAGAYPGLSVKDYYAVTSEPTAEFGQWNYDFSDSDGPQLGTVAIDGSPTVSECEDAVVIIAEHTSLKVPLPPAITAPVDLIVLADRADTGFAERKFLVMEDTASNNELKIGAYATFADMPKGMKIIGRVVMVQIPWLPEMKPTKTGFLEADEYF